MCGIETGYPELPTFRWTDRNAFKSEIDEVRRVTSQFLVPAKAAEAHDVIVELSDIRDRRLFVSETRRLGGSDIGQQRTLFSGTSVSCRRVQLTGVGHYHLGTETPAANCGRSHPPGALSVASS